MIEPITIPANELYWGVIDTSRFPPLPFAKFRPDAVYNRLANQFDAVLPIAVEELHTVYRPIGDHRVLACGIEIARIAEIRESNVIEARPSNIPDVVHIGQDGDGPASTLERLNLLTGTYLALPTVAAQRRWCRWLAAAIVTVAVFVTIGNIRREATLVASVSEFQSQQGEFYRAALGPETVGQPPAVRLTSELRRLSATRGVGRQLLESNDATLDLEALFRIWPADVEFRVERIAVSIDRIDIVVEASSTDSIETLIDALEELDGWEFPQRRVDQGKAGQASRARLGFERIKTDGGRS